MKAGLTTCTDTLSCIVCMTWFAMAGGVPPECTSMHASMRFSTTRTWDSRPQIAVHLHAGCVSMPMLI